MMRNPIVFCISLLWLVACSRPLTTLEQDFTETNSQQKAYVLFAIESDSLIESLRISGAEHFKMQFELGDDKQKFILAQVISGDYKFAQFKSGIRDYPFKETDWWRFNVKAGYINYVGHLKLSESRQLGEFYPPIIINESTSALLYLEKQFPLLLASLPTRWVGFGQDGFLHKVSQ